MTDQISYDAVGYFAVAISILVLASAIVESLMLRLPAVRARELRQAINDN